MILLAHIDSILYLTCLLAISFILNPSFDTNFNMWYSKSADSRNWNNAAARKNASIMYTGLQSSSFNCHNRLSLTSIEHAHSPKVKFTSLIAWFSANRREFINVMSKGCFRSVFLDNKSKVANRQRSFAKLGLRKWRRTKCSFDKAYLNILRADRPGTEQDKKVGI